MPVHLICGDNFLVSQALKELQGQVAPPETVEFNSHRLPGAQIDLGQLRAVCDAVPFLAQHRLVVVEGLLSLSGTRPGRRGAAAPSARRASTSGGPGDPGRWAELPEYIRQDMPPTTLLVFLEDALPRGSTLLEKLKDVIQVEEHPTPYGEALARWIRNRVAEKGAQITPGAIRLLSQMVGGNLWAVDNELEKLALYAGDRAIEEGDIGLLTSQAREPTIFSAVDALLEGRSTAALKMMLRLRDDGAELPYLVAMIARQLRLVTLARDLMDAGHGGAELGGRLGISRDFVLKKTVEQARKHSRDTLRWLYGKLLEADLAVKQGKLDQDLALQLLAASSEARPAAAPDAARLRPAHH